jgi:hypothetical protein
MIFFYLTNTVANDSLPISPAFIVLWNISSYYMLPKRERGMDIWSSLDATER